MQITQVSQPLGYTTISYEVCGTSAMSPLAYWLKERLFLTVNATMATQMLLLIDAQSDDDALVYELKVGNNYIELTNIIDSNSREIVIKTRGVESTIVETTLQIQIVGDVDYRRINIPHNDKTSTDLYQLPPRKMYTLYGCEIQAEVGALADFTLDGSMISVPSSSQYVECILGEASNTVTINDWQTVLQDVPCGQPYRRVQWRGRLGGNKEHYWLLKYRKWSVGDSVELQSRGYEARKAATETMTLYIDDLSEYDVYYYADIITSDVVIIDGKQASVRTSSITYSNGLDNGSIEVEVETHATTMA